MLAEHKRVLVDVSSISQFPYRMAMALNVRARSARLERRSDGVSAFNEPDASNLLFTFHQADTGWHTMDSAFVFLEILQ